MNNEAWRDRAACKGKPIEWFYAPDSRTAEHAVANAKACCAACPVIDECRRYASDNCERYGIWAGEAARTVRRRDLASGKAVRVVVCRVCDTSFEVLGTLRTAFCSDACREEQARRVGRECAARNPVSTAGPQCKWCGETINNRSGYPGYCGWEHYRMDARRRYQMIEVAS